MSVAEPTSTAPPPTSAEAFCAQGLTVQQDGTVASDELSEISGIARGGPWGQDVLWVHNDSGDSATLYAINRLGELLARVDVEGAQAIDWEDLAAGPGPFADRTYLFAADIGDNGASREHVVVYRMIEPELAATSTSADAVTLVYPDRPHDAEAFMVDPITGDWYLLTKEGGEPSTLFRAARPPEGPSTITLEPVTTVEIRPDFATAGDISPDGTALVIRTYFSVRVYPIDGGDVAGALAGEPCRLPFPPEVQGEAVAVGWDGRDVFTISEGTHPAVYHIA